MIIKKSNAAQVWFFPPYLVVFSLILSFALEYLFFSYPIIELSTGLLVWLNFYANPTIYSQLAVPIILFCGTILSSILITLAILDFKYFWLPQAITIGATGFEPAT